MVNYERLAATAQRLIEANGRTVTLFKKDRAPANPSQPWRGPGEEPEGTLSPVAAIVPVRGTGLGKMTKDEKGGLSRNADMVALIASSSVAGVDLAEYDSLLDREQLFKIVEREELNPGSTSLIFSLGLKA